MKNKTITTTVVFLVLCFCRSCQKKGSSPESGSSAEKAERSQAAPEAVPAPPENLNEDLVMAAWSGDPGEVQRLLKAGADINAKDSFGFTALMRASERGHVELVKALLQAGTRIDDPIDRSGYTALMQAARGGKTEIVRTLLELGAQINAKDHEGRTALAYAKETGQAEIVEILIKAGGKD